MSNVGVRRIDKSVEDLEQLDQTEADDEELNAPVGTESSAKDAREVVEMISGDLGEDRCEHPEQN
jgi:hypothetical protein